MSQPSHANSAATSPNPTSGEGKSYPSNLKLLLIGNSADEETSATIGVDFKVKQLEVEGHRYKLSIWDTAGQERFLYDVSSRQSFQALTSWFRELSTYTSPEVVKMIVGNKVDKETFSREVSTKEGEEFAKRMNCQFIECSAKTNLGVVEAFKELVLRIVDTPSLWSNEGRNTVKDRTLASTSSTIKIDDMPGGWGSSLSSCSC
ncbi:hypothetical protein QFC21_006725 [Naganishia friedmannii]|uniref:Uncharacterized protein n=1 Tax=Naganishia friedmannii TaxID=89922 RepID=A0ACC2V0X6_9TREE|nr:hypothetical protein QFC21_006725 [Naganishia friedmannii]